MSGLPAAVPPPTFPTAGERCVWRLSPFLCEFRGGVSFCEQVFWSRRGIGSPEEVVPEAPVIPESVANLGVQVLEQIPKQQIGPN